MADTLLDFINDPFSTPNSAANEVVKQINEKGGIGGDGGGGTALTATVPLSTSQILHLHSAPITIVPNPGPGKAIVPVSAAYANKFGTIPFTGDARLFWGASSSGLALLQANIATTHDSISFDIDSGLLTETYAAMGDVPVVLSCSTEPASFGKITSSNVQAAGSGYAVNDTGIIDGGSSSGYTVNAVDGGGGVTAYTVDAGSSGYATGVTTTEVGTGAGDGLFTVDITAIAPGDGTGSLTFVYYVLPLA